MTNPSVSESLTDAMVNVGAGWTVWVLVALSALSLGIALERAWVVWTRKDNLAELMQSLHTRLLQHDYAGADMVLRSGQGVEAAVAAAGLAQWQKGPRAVAEAMAAAKGIERARLERRLCLLSTMGSSAPFIGLLGTVIGCVKAFGSLALKDGFRPMLVVPPERMMRTIAEALGTTAVGLLVAIPVMITFNYFQEAVTVTMQGADTLGHILSSHVEGATYATQISSVRRS